MVLDGLCFITHTDLWLGKAMSCFFGMFWLVFFTIWFCGFSPVFVALLLLAALVFRHTSDTPGSTSNTQNLRQQPGDARGVKRQMLAGAIQ